jgi:hypothetical protein
MADAEIKAGDVAHDLVEHTKVFVLERAALTVAAHQQQTDYDVADYKASALLDVRDDEAVWTCVYLPDSPTTRFSGTHDFPASRLARIPVEAANQRPERPQLRQMRIMLAVLIEEAEDSDAVVQLARDAGFDGDVVDAAVEFADTGGDGV